MCLFCAIVEGTGPAHTVFEDDAHVAFLDVNPAVQGHVLLIPRRHVSTIYGLNAAEFTALFDLVRRRGPRLATAMGADRTALAVEGYGVDHAHVHLVPVTGGGQLDPCKQRPGSADQLRAIAARLRPALDESGL